MKVLIFGCGYLGSRVAANWHQAGCEVSVVTRSEANAKRFRSLGYEPIIADITDTNSLARIRFEFDIILFAVGFDRTKYSDIREVYVEGLKNVLAKISTTKVHFIYMSSTGVYGDCQGEWIDEATKAEPFRPGGKACLEAEELIRAGEFDYTILRLAGIYGPDRVPRLKAMREQAWEELGQTGHINLIHVADAAKIVASVVEQKIVNETFLVSDGQPADRKEFYEFIAQQLRTGPIDWTVKTEPDASRRSAADKKVSNRKLVEFTSYEFQFPDYRVGIKDAVQSI